MKHRVIRVLLVSACLAIVVMAAPVAAQQDAVEQGLTASTMSVYTPPACVPGVPFSDITCTTGFDPWIEQFGLDGITAGCGGGKYCPGTPVTRDQMAVFIEKSMRGTSNWPPHVATAWAVKNSDGTPNPTASGTALLAAIASIPQTGNDAPSAANPWLLKVGPGVYDVGDAMSAVLPAWVSMEGAGEEATVVTGSYGMGTLAISGSAGVRFLTAVSTSDAFARPIWVQAGQVTLAHVAANASNTGGATIALELDAGSSVTASNCSFTSTGYDDVEGIRDGGILYLDNVDINATGSYPNGFHAAGVYSWDGHGWTEIRNSRIAVTATSGGSSYGITWVGGGISVTGSSIRCLSPGALGVWVMDGNCYLSDLEVDAPLGTALDTSGTQGGILEVHHCKILGSFLISNGAGFNALIGASEISGARTNNGTLKCAGNYDPAGTFYANTCP